MLLLPIVAATVQPSNMTQWKQRVLDELTTIQSLRTELSAERAEAGRPRMGVCMTGQMGRFELRSKLENLIASNIEQYAIDVVMVLAPPDHTRFSNPKSDPGGRRHWSSEQIRAHTMRRFATQGMQLVVDASEQDSFPYVDSDYFKVSNKPGLGIARIYSHVRQWTALVLCWKHFSRLERRGPPYDVFVKVRDDSFILGRWSIRESQYRNKVVISECLGFGGYNDKVAVIDARHAETYFTRPIYEYSFHYPSLGINHGSPESLLRAVLRKYEVSVRQVSVDNMPIFTNRIESIKSNASVCFVFDAFKIGRSPSCWPKSCLLRQLLYCAKCPLVHRVPINLTDFFGHDHGRERCRGPNHDACKLLRRRLRRHQSH